jgi:hypothetical protein
MSKIDKHIEELLHSHDCVIVPDFGGFITSKQSTYYNKFTSVFHPATKKTLFNKHLVFNDGLLAAKVAEKQELSILFMHYLIKCRGNQVIYLGQNISTNDLIDAYQISKPNYIFTMITETYANKPVQQYVDQLSVSFPESKILLSGYQVVAQDVESSNNISILKSLFDAIETLNEIKNRSCEK